VLEHGPIGSPGLLPAVVRKYPINPKESIVKDSSLARFRGAGSFMAGILIGLSIMVPMFALMVVDLTEWQTFLFFGAPFILALGIALQAAITAKARHLRDINVAPGWHTVR
jgi:uncharacterized membrane protein